jgi:PPOX class probable F420-dependent enzyme
MDITTAQRKALLTEDGRTAVLAITRADGRPHATPVWFALDGEDVLVNIGENTVKGKALQRDPRVTLVVDTGAPPYTFVMLEGEAEIFRDSNEIHRGSTMIARRYLDDEAAAGWVNGYATGPGKVLVRVRPTHIVARQLG